MSADPLWLSSRREFLRRFAGATALLGAKPWLNVASAAAASGAATNADVNASAHSADGAPWFRRCYRWGQTNLTEVDPERFDLPFWRAQWKRTCVQGVVVNAGGIVAYYPTKIPLHRRAAKLGEHDLFGDILRAARADGLAVQARMDSNRADESFYRAHPDWFAVDANGKPYQVTDLYVACVNGPYYDEHIPAILREVATLYSPDGFTDNNWNGPMRHQPCFCENCQAKFRARSGHGIPVKADWNDPVYRDWIMWNYERRLQIWDNFNRITREAGGPHCIWVGMMAGAQNWQSRVFRDDREIYRRTELIMLDDQRRFDGEGFQHNGEIGQRIHSVGGWEKLIPESNAMYHLADHNFRLAAKPPAEVYSWVLEGIAGGVQPWWHHVGSQQPDQRQLHTAQPLWQWHRDHEEFLVNRMPVAQIGLVWSQRNMDFFGRDDGAAQVDDPWNGFMQAMVRARIPYVPVHLDDVERVTRELGLRTLVLPNLAAMSDGQAASLRAFVAAGGSLFATGLSSLCNEWGETREDFSLADVLGVHLPEKHAWRNDALRLRQAKEWTQTYLRLASSRHPVLRGFEETEILAFGGVLEDLRVAEDAVVPLTFIPAIPTSPPEEVWMRVPSTEIPGLVLRELKSGARVAYSPADLDRRFSRENLPDHGDLLRNILLWLARDDVPFIIEGTGLVDAHLYSQPGRRVLHLVNLTSAGTWRTPVHEVIPLGPFQIKVKTENSSRVRSLVSNKPLHGEIRDGWIHFEVARLVDHDVFVLE
ncbi:MAG TPA: alpha-amylase family protein [Opitutaceae bacterium]|nr:alpha-amylase family protein [Opitutaceae bacterium]